MAARGRAACLADIQRVGPVARRDRGRYSSDGLHVHVDD